MNYFNKREYFIVIIVTTLLLLNMGFTWNALSTSNNNYLYPFEQNYKWGFIDYEGNVIVKPQFDEAEEFSDGLALVAFYDPDGIPFYGFINAKGEWVVEPKLYFARSFSEGLAIIEMESYEFAFINVRGEVVLSLPDIALPFSENLAPLVDPKTDKTGYIDKSGNWVLQPQFLYAEPFTEGLARVCESSCGYFFYGYINRNGEVVIPLQYYYASDFHEGLAWVRQRQKEPGFYINKVGEKVEELNLPYIGKSFSEGLTYASIDDKYYGYVNPKGEWVLPPKYTKAENFSEGLAFVKMGEQSYFIDKQGNIKISLEGVSGCKKGFKNGLAIVYRNYKKVFINTAGEVIFTVP